MREPDVYLERITNHSDIIDLDHFAGVRTSFHISNKNSSSVIKKNIPENWTALHLKAKKISKQRLLLLDISQ